MIMTVLLQYFLTEEYRNKENQVFSLIPINKDYIESGGGGWGGGVN